MNRLLPAIAAVLIAATGVFGLLSRPATASPTGRADYVVVAGAAGLRWDDINATDTPTLWKLAQQGSIGALSVRSAAALTCPADGWLTLGAGNLARRGSDPQVDATGQCPAMSVPLARPDSIGASLTDQAKVVQLNKELPYGAQPGALAEAVRCTAAVGTGAAVAAARPYGRVDKYAEEFPTDLRGYLASCVLSMVDLGTLTAVDPAVRQQQATAVDNQLATVLANRPARSLLLVAGLADTQAGTRLHVAIADGPGYSGGWLTSSSTARTGYVQLADLAPTVLAALDKPVPAAALRRAAGGQPVRPPRQPDRRGPGARRRRPPGQCPAQRGRWLLPVAGDRRADPVPRRGAAAAPGPPPCRPAPHHTCARSRTRWSGRWSWPWWRRRWRFRPRWSPTPCPGGVPTTRVCCSERSRWR